MTMFFIAKILIPLSCYGISLVDLPLDTELWGRELRYFIYFFMKKQINITYNILLHSLDI